MLHRKHTDKRIFHKAFLTKKPSLRAPQNIATHFSGNRVKTQPPPPPSRRSYMRQRKQKRAETKNAPPFRMKHWSNLKFAVRTGLEPVTPCVTGMYSNQLN